MVIALVALLGTGAIVMDVGFAWYAKRQVQASADAAALAGAQQLPDVTSATATANQYASLNTPDNLSNVSVNVTTRCSVTATANNWCGPGKAYQANTIAVTETAKSPTWFAKIFGINHFDVKGVATACQPCSSSPVDIMLVDRPYGLDVLADGTGRRVHRPEQREGRRANAARDHGPEHRHVGLVAFPPYNTNGASVCGNTSRATPVVINGATVDSPSYYDQANLVYLDDPLGSDFKTSATSTHAQPGEQPRQAHRRTTPRRHPQLHQELRLDVVRRGAQGAAQAELVKDGRPGRAEGHRVHDGRRGEPGLVLGRRRRRTGSSPTSATPRRTSTWPSGAPRRSTPATPSPAMTRSTPRPRSRLTGTTIYTIGYDLFDQTTGYAYCVHGVWGQIDKSQASSSTDWTELQVHDDREPAPEPSRRHRPCRAGDHAHAAGHYQGVYPAPRAEQRTATRTRAPTPSRAITARFRTSRATRRCRASPRPATSTTSPRPAT